jgi:hypothetical protein
MMIDPLIRDQLGGSYRESVKTQPSISSKRNTPQANMKQYCSKNSAIIVAAKNPEPVPRITYEEKKKSVKLLILDTQHDRRAFSPNESPLGSKAMVPMDYESSDD